MVPDMPITLLVAVVFVLTVVYIFLRSLRMPPSFFEKQRERDRLRREFLKKEIIPPEELHIEEES